MLKISKDEAIVLLAFLQETNIKGKDVPNYIHLAGKLSDFVNGKGGEEDYEEVSD